MAKTKEFSPNMRFLSLILSLAIAFAPVSSLWAEHGGPHPAGDDLLQGDWVSLDQVQEGQLQDQAQLQNQQALAQTLNQQVSMVQTVGDVTLDTIPNYSNQVEEGEIFESSWTFENVGDTREDVTMTLRVTPIGGTEEDTIELSMDLVVHPGRWTFLCDMSFQALIDAGITPGEYLIDFVALDDSGNLINEFLDNPLLVGEQPPVSPAPLEFLLAQQVPSGTRSGLLESWVIPLNDPLAPFLVDRAFVYDQAVAVIALTEAGQTDQAEQILLTLQALEDGTGRLGFSYKTEPSGAGTDFLAIFTGTMAWVGNAALFYQIQTDDTQFRSMAARLADTLLTFLDPATGLLKGGLDADGNPFPWISTEHNIDAYFFLRDLAVQTGQLRFSDAAEGIKQGIRDHLWTGDHFRQGFQDDVVVLDAQALGGLFWVAVGETALAQTARDFIEDNFKVTVEVNDQPVSGYAPYILDDFIWTEGSMMVALLDRRLGESASADAIEQALETFQDTSGGLDYASSRSQTTQPGTDTTFPDLPNVAATAWGLMQNGNPPALLAVDPQTTFEIAPTFTETVAPGGDFEAEFDIGNTGDAPDQVALTVVFTPVGTQNSIEVSRTVTVSPGGGLFDFHLTAAEFSLFNITPGFYTITFLAFDGAERRIGDSFFSALIEFLLG